MPSFQWQDVTVEDDGLIDGLGKETARHLSRQSKVIAMDERVKAAARRHGFEVCEDEDRLFRFRDRG